jgi:hypothetical protein
MKRYYFSGVIHPQRAIISLEFPETEIQTFEGRPLIKCKGNVYNNQLSVVVYSEDESLDYYTLRNYVKANVTTFINIVGFVLGRSYDVEITKAFGDDIQGTQVFGIDIGSIAEDNKHINMQQAMGHLLSLCSGPDGIFTRRCLDDLIMSIRYLDDTAFYCFRAIESLKQYFGKKHNLTNDALKWKAFAEAVRGVKNELDEIKVLANPSRHGFPVYISDETRRKIFEKTWDIVRRFIDYRFQELGIDYRLGKGENAA